MTRSHRLFLSCGRRSPQVVFILAATILTIANAPPALAIVPVNSLVLPGTFDEAVRITNIQGSRGTGTLFGKMYEADPANPMANPQRYLNLCFLTADHVLRPLLPGGIPNDPDNDSYPAGSIYEDSPSYGGGYDPAVQPQPVLDTYLTSVGFRSIGDPTAFSLSAANGVVATKVVMGDNLSGVGNGRIDAAFAAIRVDLNHPLLTPAQKAILNALTPETLAFLPPVAGPFPKNIVPVPFSIEGGYGLSGRPDVAVPGYDFVYHPAVPVDEQYGIERDLDNNWTRLVQTQGFYNYTASQWTLQPVIVNGQQVDTLGVGLSGDSGAGMFTNDVNGNPALAGPLTAGRMDKLAGGNVGLKYGYSEIGAPLTQLAANTFINACDTFLISVPEPATATLGLLFLAVVAMRRESRPKRY